MNNAFVRAREVAEQSTTDRQERNRLWWETLPMTYRSWEESDRGVKDPQGFSRLESDYLDGNPWLKEHFNFGAFKGQKTLEIGCGAGAASCLFARGGADHTAVDLTEQAIKITTENAAAQHLNMRLTRMDAEKLEFPDNTFDHVFAWGVLHHSQDTSACFRQVGRVLKPGGTGLIMVYYKYSIRYWVRGLQGLIGHGLMFKGYNMQSVQGFFTDGYYQRHFSKTELARMLRASGLEPTRFSVSHMKSKYIRPLPTFMDPWLKRNWGWLVIAEFRKPG